MLRVVQGIRDNDGGSKGKNTTGINLSQISCQYLKDFPGLIVSLFMVDILISFGLSYQQALGYAFDNDEFHAYVHGRLPYDVLKPDPTLRNLLLSMPQRKIVRQNCLIYSFTYVDTSVNENYCNKLLILRLFSVGFQIFTNADEAHAAQVLSRLGLEGCFEGIISFETLNPPPLEPVYNCMDVPDGDDAEFTAGTEANVPDCTSLSSYSRVLCKPSVEAIEAAIQIANIDPNKTVIYIHYSKHISRGFKQLNIVGVSDEDFFFLFSDILR